MADVHPAPRRILGALPAPRAAVIAGRRAILAGAGITIFDSPEGHRSFLGPAPEPGWQPRTAITLLGDGSGRLVDGVPASMRAAHEDCPAMDGVAGPSARWSTGDLNSYEHTMEAHHALPSTATLLPWLSHVTMAALRVRHSAARNALQPLAEGRESVVLDALGHELGELLPVDAMAAIHRTGVLAGEGQNTKPIGLRHRVYGALSSHPHLRELLTALPRLQMPVATLLNAERADAIANLTRPPTHPTEPTPAPTTITAGFAGRGLSQREQATEVLHAYFATCSSLVRPAVSRETMATPEMIRYLKTDGPLLDDAFRYGSRVTTALLTAHWDPTLRETHSLSPDQLRAIAAAPATGYTEKALRLYERCIARRVEPTLPNVLFRQADVGKAALARFGGTLTLSANGVLDDLGDAEFGHARPTDTTRPSLYSGRTGVGGVLAEYDAHRRREMARRLREDLLAEMDAAEERIAMDGADEEFPAPTESSRAVTLEDGTTVQLVWDQTALDVAVTGVLLEHCYGDDWQVDRYRNGEVVPIRIERTDRTVADPRWRGAPDEAPQVPEIMASAHVCPETHHTTEIRGRRNATLPDTLLAQIAGPLAAMTGMAPALVPHDDPLSLINAASRAARPHEAGGDANIEWATADDDDEGQRVPADLGLTEDQIEMLARSKTLPPPVRQALTARLNIDQPDFPAALAVSWTLNSRTAAVSDAPDLSATADTDVARALWNAAGVFDGSTRPFPADPTQGAEASDVIETALARSLHPTVQADPRLPLALARTLRAIRANPALLVTTPHLAPALRCRPSDERAYYDRMTTEWLTAAQDDHAVHGAPVSILTAPLLAEPFAALQAAVAPDAPVIRPTAPTGGDAWRPTVEAPPVPRATVAPPPPPARARQH